VVGAFAAFYPFDEIENEGFDGIGHGCVGCDPPKFWCRRTPTATCLPHSSAALVADLHLGRRVPLALPATHGSPPGIWSPRTYPAHARTLSQVDGQSGVVSAAGDPLDIKFESFVELEYTRDPAPRIHRTLGGFSAEERTTT
jgi:hypothetical protein